MECRGKTRLQVQVFYECPYTPSRKQESVEEFLSDRIPLLEKNISYRFRDYSQFTFISLANHLQLLEGNRHIARPDLVYLKPQTTGKLYEE